MSTKLSTLLLLLLLLLFFCIIIVIALPRRGDVRRIMEKEKEVKIAAAPWGRVQIAAGSRVPDCSHACGSCSPCRLVIVSFVCSKLEEAETCPMAYKCICRNKSFPVP